jgi:hypothetical protein
MRLPQALLEAERTYPSPETNQIVRFIQSGRRGLLSFAS